MSSDPVLCFNHCDLDVNLLCLELPSTCPLCSGDLQSTPMKIPPFRLPSPLQHSGEAPYSVVIRPTQGTFLDQYGKDSNLHVGISNSKGVVYDFDEKGLNRSLQGWSQCVAITIATRTDVRLTSIWDLKLQEFACYEHWTAPRYDENTWNCYDFVLGFLQLLRLGEQLPCIKTKGEFCEEMVVPRTSEVAKYISMYRKVLQKGVMVQYSTSL